MKKRFAGRDYEFGSRTFIMGVLNITPDSFSDGGKYFDGSVRIDRVVREAVQMEKDGADFIDIGGESTRPGAAKISVEEELRRVLPAVREVCRHINIPVSIDTYKSEVAEECLKAGARIVNDISGFRFDERMAAVTSKHGASCVLMHIKGTPENMQKDPVYADVAGEVRDYLADSVDIARRHGIESIMTDPGIGFGKTLEDNLELIRNLNMFRDIGYPVLIGLSRKSFIDKIHITSMEERIHGTLTANTAAVGFGADVIRVHDVKQNYLGIKIADKILRNSYAESK